MTQTKQYLSNLYSQLRKKFRDRTRTTIDDIIFVIECENEILKGRETRYAIAYDGSLGVQQIMKDSIRKPVTFLYD